MVDNRRLCFEALTYVPCQIDPGAAPDAIYAFAPEVDGDGGEGAFDVDISLCSRGYSQTLTVYEDGVPVRTAAAPLAADVSDATRRRRQRQQQAALTFLPGEIYPLPSTPPTCGLGDAVSSLRMKPGHVYHVVVDGQHGFPYGSFRGGAGVRIKRRDGRAFQPGGFDAAAGSRSSTRSFFFSARLKAA